MTPEEFDDWRDSEITKRVFNWISGTVIDCENAWGELLRGSNINLEIKRAELAERIILATEIINVSYEDIKKENEPDRDSSD